MLWHVSDSARLLEGAQMVSLVREGMTGVADAGRGEQTAVPCICMCTL